MMGKAEMLKRQERGHLARLSGRCGQDARAPFAFLANARAGIEIAPLADAVARMNRKMPVAKVLTSDEWSQVPLALRERAFWSARFAQADALQVMHDAIGDRLALEKRESVGGRGAVTMSRDNFVAEMRDRLVAAGYLPPEGKAGTIMDMTSTGRLGLIFDINTQQAQEFARWKAGQAEGALDAFPAQELFRAEDREVPRNWVERWRAAGGRFFGGGRMIAAKDDPVWAEISAFGTPYPPFDFNSGMDVRDISRREAEDLGVIEPGAAVEPPDVGFNDNLQKSVARYSPGIRDAILQEFDGRAVVENSIMKWVGGGDPRAAEAVGQTGTWKSLGLRPVAEIPPDDAAPKMSVEAARRKLEEDYEVPTPLGDAARFGPHVLEHWEEKGKSAADMANRLHFLQAAEDAIRFPHEIWESDDARKTRTFIHVTKDEQKARVLHAWELRDGKLESYVSTSDLGRRGDKHRNGRLVYAR